ncbi:MAG: hypothetical protein C7K11_08835 [Candidatus Amulumruptor caecigallinarius]|uniref:DUF308 domain-containing protein n=1 Tax=Candidatus Amulumruptor caecigallinarius TaxID=2109911 RepID=A0A4Q0U759_9BACT|nr:MAG: hypothetical protein C7K11_08835 [Candidatus Amulumruptor caecigallinarius]HJE39589.1 DUF308 domain-containing protein [Candidatus Amulumruptor caecigallinarius]
MMKSLNTRLHSTRAWWVVLLTGILMVLCGFAYWFWPVAGYAVASQLFGWLLILVGAVQLVVAASNNHPRQWGWWIAGGMIDMFIGFMMVRSIILSEIILPYFLALIFIFWGINAVCNSVSDRPRKYWWLHLVNGILLTLIGFLFIESGWLQDMMMTSFITSLAFIYWGFTLSIASYGLRPVAANGDNDN